MSRWNGVALFAPGGSGPPAVTPPNLFQFALTPANDTAYWWPDNILSGASIVPASQLLILEALGEGDAQGLIANSTDPTAFVVLLRTSGADVTPMDFTLNYAAIQLGMNGVPAAFDETIAASVAPAGDTLVALTFPVTAGKITAGQVLLIQLVRGADGNADKAIIVAGALS